MNPKALLSTTLLLLPIFSACASNSARLKGDDEEIALDIKRVDTAVLREITSESLGKLFALHKSNINVAEPYLVGFAGIDSKGAEELRDHREALLDIIEEEINNSGTYRVMARRFVERAARETDIRDLEDLFLPKHRDRFVDVLGGMGQAPRYLIWASFTTQSDNIGESMFGGDKRQVVYRLTVSMVDVQSGMVDTQSGEATKEYTSK